jgi:UDPglucose--hexose-1-phosphate uridylyltransferase
MSEFRRDPFLRRWRLFAEGRSARPNEYAPGPGARGEESCPFCEGRESQTPPELAAVRAAGSGPDRPGWSVRAFPNRFPTLRPEGSTHPPERDTFFERARGYGTHEVIVTSPTHEPGLAYLPEEHQRTLFRFLRERVRAVGVDPAVSTTVLLENQGPESGGTLPHPHAQLLASEILPDRVREEHESFEVDRSSCALERVVEQERVIADRWVARDEELVAFAPFASEHPYEVWVVPRRHTSSFARATDSETDALAELLPKLLRALDAIRPGASYNWFVHSLERPPSPSESFHWHLELTPRIQRADGFELAAGLPVNAVLPERAADEYRRAMSNDRRGARKR